MIMSNKNIANLFKSNINTNNFLGFKVKKKMGMDF